MGLFNQLLNIDNLDYFWFVCKFALYMYVYTYSSRCMYIHFCWASLQFKSYLARWHIKQAQVYLLWWALKSHTDFPALSLPMSPLIFHLEPVALEKLWVMHQYSHLWILVCIHEYFFRTNAYIWSIYPPGCTTPNSSEWNADFLLCIISEHSLSTWMERHGISILF